MEIFLPLKTGAILSRKSKRLCGFSKACEHCAQFDIEVSIPQPNNIPHKKLVPASPLNM